MVKWFLGALLAELLGVACLTCVLYLYWTVMNKKQRKQLANLSALSPDNKDALAIEEKSIILKDSR